MTGKTHTAIGCATALGVASVALPSIQPMDIATILGAATVASTLPDVDVGAARQTYKYAIYGIVASVIGFVYLSRVSSTGITGTPLELVGVLLFGAMTVFGAKQPHRGFTHSILATALFSISFYLIVRGLAIGSLATFGFVVSYAAHLGLDVLNTKGCQYLYPLPQRYCLKVCKANGPVNKALELTGGFLVAFEILMLAMPRG